MHFPYSFTTINCSDFFHKLSWFSIQRLLIDPHQGASASICLLKLLIERPTFPIQLRCPNQTKSHLLPLRNSPNNHAVSFCPSPSGNGVSLTVLLSDFFLKVEFSAPRWFMGVFLHTLHIYYFNNYLVLTYFKATCGILSDYSFQSLTPMTHFFRSFRSPSFAY